MYGSMDDVRTVSMYAATHTHAQIQREGEEECRTSLPDLTYCAPAFSHLDFGCHATGEIKAKNHNDDLPAAQQNRDG